MAGTETRRNRHGKATEAKILDIAILVHIAGLICFVGFLSGDQLRLRILVLAGNATYAAYYFAVPAGPLWTLIGWSTFFILANVYGILSIILDRQHSQLTEDEKLLFSEFTDMSPGQFRKLMRSGKWMTIADRAVLTTEGRKPDSLYYVLRGTIEIEKADRRFQVQPPAFIGEIAWLLKTPATATVVVDSDSRVIQWNVSDLTVILKRHPDLRVRMENLMNRDLAGKVAKS